MTGSRPVWLAVALLAGFTWGILHLLGVQFAAGDMHPEYSSLRTDPLGSKLLYDSLARLPGLAVRRSYVPIDLLEEGSATVLLLGTAASLLDDRDTLDRIMKAARRGNRIVVALSLPITPERDTGVLERTWQVRLVIDPNESHSRRMYFTGAPAWKVLDRAGPKLMAIERAFDKGTIVLFSQSDGFANESMVMGEHLMQVAGAIGANTRILFDEAHLGIAESGSVVGLARRYHLMGFALGLVICAALALWKNASPFPLPHAARGAERTFGRTSSAGLATLLRRHIPARELASTCWQEWLKSNRHQLAADRAERANAIARAGAARPLEAAREIQQVVQAKGAS